MFAAAARAIDPLIIDVATPRCGGFSVISTI
jgi:hypothetical protein